MTDSVLVFIVKNPLHYHISAADKLTFDLGDGR